MEDFLRIKKDIEKWLPKFSATSLWKAVATASKKSYPKRYTIPHPPQIQKRDSDENGVGHIVFEYNLPGERWSKRKSIGEKAISIEEFFAKHKDQESSEYPFHSIAEMSIPIFAEYNREMRHLGILWDSICAAISASFFIQRMLIQWKAENEGKDNDEVELNDRISYLVLCCQSLGLNIERLCEITKNFPELDSESTIEMFSYDVILDKFIQTWLSEGHVQMPERAPKWLRNSLKKGSKHFFESIGVEPHEAPTATEDIQTKGHYSIWDFLPYCICPACGGIKEEDENEEGMKTEMKSQKKDNSKRKSLKSSEGYVKQVKQKTANSSPRKPKKRT